MSLRRTRRWLRLRAYLVEHWNMLLYECSAPGCHRRALRDRRLHAGEQAEATLCPTSL
jgi:hypothetical protein